MRNKAICSYTTNVETQPHHKRASPLEAVPLLTTLSRMIYSVCKGSWQHRLFWMAVLSCFPCGQLGKQYVMPCTTWRRPYRGVLCTRVLVPCKGSAPRSLLGFTCTRAPVTGWMVQNLSGKSRSHLGTCIDICTMLHVIDSLFQKRLLLVYNVPCRVLQMLFPCIRKPSKLARTLHQTHTSLCFPPLHKRDSHISDFGTQLHEFTRTWHAWQLKFVHKATNSNFSVIFLHVHGQKWPIFMTAVDIFGQQTCTLFTTRATTNMIICTKIFSWA